MDTIKVIIVDDSAIYRDLIQSVLSEIKDIIIASVANNGKLAIPRIRYYLPHILLLDQEMPEMSGIEVLEEIHSKYPEVGVIMFSSHTVEGAKVTLRALELGALDFVTKPVSATDGNPELYIRENLVPKILELGHAKHKIHPNAERVHSSLHQGLAPKTPNSTTLFRHKETKKPGSAKLLKNFFKTVAIGVSTGGPVALREVFSKIQKPVAQSLFIVQHMPPIFTKQLAESLSQISAIRFVEAEEGMIPEPNTAYIAPGGKHMALMGNSLQQEIRILEPKPTDIAKPSVDVLFESVATVFRDKAMGIILTGMGNDGYLGLKKMHENGAYAIAQSEESCLIFGMPEKPTKEGWIEESLNLQEIADRIVTAIGS